MTSHDLEPHQTWVESSEHLETQPADAIGLTTLQDDARESFPEKHSLLRSLLCMHTQLFCISEVFRVTATFHRIDSKIYSSVSLAQMSDEIGDLRSKSHILSHFAFVHLVTLRQGIHMVQGWLWV